MRYGRGFCNSKVPEKAFGRRNTIIQYAADRSFCRCIGNSVQNRHPERNACFSLFLFTFTVL